MGWLFVDCTAGGKGSGRQQPEWRGAPVHPGARRQPAASTPPINLRLPLPTLSPLLQRQRR